MIGGAAGVPFGVAALTQVSPDLLRLCAGIFLVCYALSQLSGLARLAIGHWGGRASDAAIGVGGGVLGGFAGLSGPLPLIWLQLRGGPSIDQRAVYQPFNLIVLALAGIAMGVAGRIDATVVQSLLLAVPGTVLGAWSGARLYHKASERTFRTAVLALLLLSGAMLVIGSLG